MENPSSLYPPAPPGIPADLTRPSFSYRVQTILTLLSLVLFMLFYLLLVAASGWLLYFSLVYPIGEVNRATILLKVGSIAFSGMLFLFLLKGLFKHQTTDRTLYVEVSEQEEPELFRFIRQLADDTGAPYPRRVYVSPEVNAAVFYDSSILSLILPVRKNLLIGLGLVNVLPLVELKAVLAHEFGHFSQSSMKVGSYVYMANRVIVDMVYGRDDWDDLLAKWRALDLRFGIFGWLLSGIVWGLRYVLGGVFRVINFAHLALSRQMEFNADLVAVSVTGSDALIHALSRLDFAGESLGQAMHDLSAARDHQLCTRDLFYHQGQAAQYLRATRKKPDLGEPPSLPDDAGKDGAGEKVRVFDPGEGGIPSMWATHPSNHDREENAKRHYIRSPRDDRSPWLLFRDAEHLREEVTRRYYRQAFGLENDPNLSDPERVQAFIDEEHAETTYHPRYHGLYDGRMLTPREIDDLARKDARSPQELLDTLSRHFGADLETWVKTHNQHQAEHELLSGLSGGTLELPGKVIEFREREYRRDEAPRLLKIVESDLEADSERLEELDSDVFNIHHALAAQVDAALADELVSRYRFHLAMQEVMRNVSVQQSVLNVVLAVLSNSRQVEEDDWKSLVRMLSEARTELSDSLKKADEMRLPALKNMEAGKPLGVFLLNEDLVPKLRPTDSQITGEWMGTFYRQLNVVIDRLRRMHFKSIGGILALQERIEQLGRDRVKQTEAGT